MALGHKICRSHYYDATVRARKLKFSGNIDLGMTITQNSEKLGSVAMETQKSQIADFKALFGHEVKYASLCEKLYYQCGNPSIRTIKALVLYSPEFTKGGRKRRGQEAMHLCISNSNCPIPKFHCKNFVLCIGHFARHIKPLCKPI